MIGDTVYLKLIRHKDGSIVSISKISEVVTSNCITMPGARWPKIQSIATKLVLVLRYILAEDQMLWKRDEKTCYQFLLWHQYECCKGLQSVPKE